MKIPRVAIIGGGAAGFYAAAHLRAMMPDVKIHILEKTGKVMGKVLASGGGRCNVTHDQRKAKKLAEHYPRGGEFLLSAFQRHGPGEVWRWFSQHGAELKTESDGRVFPVSDKSTTIAECLRKAALRGDSELRLHSRVSVVSPLGNGCTICINGQDEWFDAVLVTTGGGRTLDDYKLLMDLGIEVVQPVPSLFTFNAVNPAKELMGIAIPQAEIRIMAGANVMH